MTLTRPQRRLPARSSIAQTRVSLAEREQWHRAALAAGMTLGELLRTATRDLVRRIEKGDT